MIANPLTGEVLNINPEGCNQYKHCPGHYTGTHSAGKRIRTKAKAKRLTAEAITKTYDSPFSQMSGVNLEVVSQGIAQLPRKPGNAGFRRSRNWRTSSPDVFRRVHDKIADEIIKDMEEAAQPLPGQKRSKREKTILIKKLRRQDEAAQANLRAAQAHERVHLMRLSK